MSKCVVCERATSGSLEFCRKHYNDHKGDILDKKPWVKALKNEAQRERRRQEREYQDVSLDHIMEKFTDKRYL
jgi:hypothetical protein